MLTEEARGNCRLVFKFISNRLKVLGAVRVISSVILVHIISSLISIGAFGVHLLLEGI
jgi:hypothetical protein